MVNFTKHLFLTTLVITPILAAPCGTQGVRIRPITSTPGTTRPSERVSKSLRPTAQDQDPHNLKYSINFETRNPSPSGRLWSTQGSRGQTNGLLSPDASPHPPVLPGHQAIVSPLILPGQVTANTGRTVPPGTSHLSTPPPDSHVPASPMRLDTLLGTAENANPRSAMSNRGRQPRRQSLDDISELSLGPSGIPTQGSNDSPPPSPNLDNGGGNGGVGPSDFLRPWGQ